MMSMTCWMTLLPIGCAEEEPPDRRVASSPAPPPIRLHFVSKLVGGSRILKKLLMISKRISFCRVLLHTTQFAQGHTILGERPAHSFPSTSTSISLSQRNVRKEEIINLLVSPNNDNVFIVAIVGIGGLGKSTLAQLVYNNEIVKKHFEPQKWVCVSDESGHEVFGETALLKKITKSKNDERDKSQLLDDLKNELHKK